MAQPMIYDVMVDGRKVSGGAQRRTKHGFLHQGTIALTAPSEEFLKGVLKPGTCVFRAMQEHTYALLPRSNETELEKAKQDLREQLVQAFRCP
jgi:lipoate-protein ligase A